MYFASSCPEPDLGPRRRISLRQVGHAVCAIELASAFVLVHRRLCGGAVGLFPWYVTLMEVKVKALGAHHHLTLLAMVNLASSFRKQGRFSDTEELAARVKQTKLNSCSRKA